MQHFAVKTVMLIAFCIALFCPGTSRSTRSSNCQRHCPTQSSMLTSIKYVLTQRQLSCIGHRSIKQRVFQKPTMYPSTRQHPGKLSRASRKLIYRSWANLTRMFTLGSPTCCCRNEKTRLAEQRWPMDTTISRWTRTDKSKTSWAYSCGANVCLLRFHSHRDASMSYLTFQEARPTFFCSSRRSHCHHWALRGDLATITSFHWKRLHSAWSSDSRSWILSLVCCSREFWRRDRTAYAKFLQNFRNFASGSWKHRSQGNFCQVSFPYPI